MAFALLRETGLDTSAIPGAALYEKMLAAGLNCPLSSGMGRLFDGVAAILGFKTLASYEGQGAVLLEAAATETEARYPFALEGSPLRFDWRPTIRALAEDRDRGLPTGEIAGRFHNTLVAMAVETCRAAREKTKIYDVALSGGTFQNMILMRTLPAALEKEGFRVLRHHRVSPNDEGLSLGQLMIAEALLEEREHVSGGSAEAD